MCPALDDDDDDDDLACHIMGTFCGQRNVRSPQWSNPAIINALPNIILGGELMCYPFWSDFDGLFSPLSSRIRICLVPFLSRRT